MNGIVQDIRFALRGFGRNPGFTLVAILVLALGIGANTAIFSVVDALVLRPLPFPASDQLVAIHNRAADSPRLRPILGARRGGSARAKPVAGSAGDLPRAAAGAQRVR